MYMLTKYLHLITVALSVTLFVLRAFWLWRKSAWLQAKWVRITPHVNDTLLLLSGIILMVLSYSYPFTAYGQWMTEKLVLVIAYIGLGHMALGRRPKPGIVRIVGFLLAMLCLVLIVHLSQTKAAILLGAM